MREQNDVFGGCSESVIGACIEVHRHLGPGLLESAYEQCVAHELTLRGLRFERQRAVPLDYKGMPLECGYRLDFVVEAELIVEIKSVDRLSPLLPVGLNGRTKRGAGPPPRTCCRGERGGSLRLARPSSAPVPQAQPVPAWRSRARPA